MDNGPINFNMKSMPTRLVLSPDALARELNGEILILDLRTSQYFGLTGSGARIWQLIEAGLERDALSTALRQEFSGDPQRIDDEVAQFVSDLIERGLLVDEPA